MAHKRRVPLRRKRSYRDIKETFLIIFEGKNTEPIYFKSFQLTNADVKTITHAHEGNALSFVAEAIKTKKTEKDYDNYWIVIDKDENGDSDFNTAIKKAKDNGFNVAYSNQAFEFWYILHFKCHIGLMHRKDYKKLLSKFLGFQYNKTRETCRKIYNALLPNQAQAIRNAEIVYEKIGDHSNIAREESSTTVHELVKSLNRFL